ncbi:MAG: glycosyltransferase family 39 protein [Leptolyngbyaceae cyanobacterium bins.349]|nr:glycosyltransferase family 39 protein [Leptolyngbyaceae cyanobacterium bins.349]
MKGFERLATLGLILTLGCLLGLTGFSLWGNASVAAKPVHWADQARWITAPTASYRLYARRTVDIADGVDAAWLRLSADNDFILYVNGKVVASESNGAQNSLGLASRLSDRAQRLNDSQPYRFISPEWIHLAPPHDWKLTVYSDLTADLHPGKNVIAIALQKSHFSPRVVVEGAIQTVGGGVIDLTTGATPWKVSSQAANRQDIRWFEPDYEDNQWDAPVGGKVRDVTYSRLSQHLFDRPFQANWITGAETSQGEVFLRGNWQIPSGSGRAFIRFAGADNYALLLNGQLVKPLKAATDQLFLSEVTHLLHPGNNVLAAHLMREINPAHVPLDPLSFVLDGWVETTGGAVTAAIATDTTWNSIPSPVPQWDLGHGAGNPISLVKAAQPQGFERQFQGDAALLNYPSYLRRVSLWIGGGVMFACTWAWAFGRFWLNAQRDRWQTLGVGAGLLLPGTFVLMGVGLLQHRYAEVEQGLFLTQPQSHGLLLASFLSVVLLTLLASQAKRHAIALGHSITVLSVVRLLLGATAFISLSLFLAILTQFTLIPLPVLLLLLIGAVGTYLFFPSIRGLDANWRTLCNAIAPWAEWLGLTLILGIAFILRVYHLSPFGFEADEMTSLDAAKGILQTGAPETAAGIWYTRGPVYHYLLAGWLAFTGTAPENGRFLSVLCGVASLFLVFILAKKVTGKVWIALLITAILAIDPNELWYSRFTRFYQLLQFFSLLTFWAFIKGFIEKSGRQYQLLFFIAFTGALLTQELTITLVPCFLVAFLCFYRPFSLSKDWGIVVSAVFVLCLYAYNGIFVSAKSLTPLVALSSSTDALLKFHLSNLAGFVSIFFVGPSRIYSIYALFFVLGGVYALKRRHTNALFLYLCVILNLIILTLVVFQSASRYVQHIYPLFILLSVYGAICVSASLAKPLERLLQSLVPIQSIAISLTVLLLVFNTEPARALTAYNHALLAGHSSIAEYIKAQRQPGDIVISYAPGVYAPITRLDYYLPHRLAPFDALYLKEGRLIDRWAGAVLINNIDQLNQVLSQGHRVWIHRSDRPMPRDPHLAELQRYIETLGEPELETLGASLSVWSPEKGTMPPQIPNQGRDLGTY